MNCISAKCPDWLSVLMQKAGGTVPFSQYMDWALNEDQYGAYSSGKLSIGKKGDFVTSPSLGSEFCELLVKQIAEWIIDIESYNTNSVISIVDIGPGEADLTFHLISAFKSQYPHLISKIEFVLVEINIGMISRQKKRLKAFRDLRIRWTSFMELSLKPVIGIFIAPNIAIIDDILFDLS